MGDDSIVVRSQHNLSWVACCAADGLVLLWLDNQLSLAGPPRWNGDDEALYEHMLWSATIDHAVDVILFAEELLRIPGLTRPAVLLKSTKLLKYVLRYGRDYPTEAQADRW